MKVAEIFRRHGYAYIEARQPVSSQVRVMRAVAACRTAVMGGHLDKCDHCGHERPAYNSCRNRHCPSCQTAARDDWLEGRLERVLPTHHFHVVFTLPQELRPIALRNQVEVYGIMVKAAAETLATLGRDLAAQRAQLEDRIADLDATIRRTAAQVINGLIDEDDAKVLNAPLLAQREQARLELAALPSERVLPSPDEIDPERFRAEVLRAWREAPLEDQREALGKLLSEVRLSPGGVTIRYGLGGYHIHDPYGPPYAPMSARLPSGS